MNSDLLAVLDYLERDRGLEREVITKVIEEAMSSAARKADGPNDITVTLDPSTGDITAIAKALVVETVEDRTTEISLTEAQVHDPDCKVGAEVTWEIPTKELGRIVAQTTRQGIFQRLRQVEKDLVRDEYKDRVGEILYGVICRFDKGDVVVDFGGHEGTLRHEDRILSEDYQVGDHVSCVLVDVNMDRPGPVLRVSRSADSLIERLFEREVTEIAEGIVEIKAVAREPGFRSKIAVASNDSKVDPVGACVGIRGTRVKTIVRELNGERIDIIPWSADVHKFVANALQPAEIKSLKLDEERGQVHIIVDKDQLSLAIGKRGQNARLAHRLTGWKIDIKKESEIEVISIEEKMQEVARTLATSMGIDTETAQKLVDNGYLSADGILAAEIDDLVAIEGIDDERAREIMEAAQ